MIDDDLLELVEYRFPYPIAVECRKLSTIEYAEKDEKRLKRLLQVAERTVHFLSFILLSDLLEHGRSGKLVVSKALQADFKQRFRGVSFGTSIHILRESIRTGEANGIEFFVREISELLATEGDRSGGFFPSVNELVKLRNQLAHEKSKPNPAMLREFCESTEDHLNRILQAVEFLASYNLLWVGEIQVNKQRWKAPQFRHKFSRVVGMSDIFKSMERDYPEYMDS